MTIPNQSPLDSQPYFSFIRKQIEHYGQTNTSIADQLTKGITLEGSFYALPTSETSIRRFRERHQLGVPTRDQININFDGDEAELSSPPIVTDQRPWKHMDDPDMMLRERGLDPKDWSIKGATVNEWDGPQEGGSVVTYHQAKLQLVRKQPQLQILPARIDKPDLKVLKIPDFGITNEPELIVVVGDQQAPFHDETLHLLFCEWLASNYPDRGISLGDKMDLPDISKYRLDPENTATVQECVDSAGQIFRDYTVSSPNTSWQVLAGNHDERLRNILLDRNLGSLHGVRQAKWSDEQEKEAALAIPHLLRLDELGMEYIDPKGPYDLAQININKNLAVRHGWIARQGSGASALETLKHLGYSVIVGHTHRQSIVYKTTHDITGETTTLTAAEAGCMCKVNKDSVSDKRQWPNYSPAPDWQQGFSTVTIHPNGLFRVENATFVNTSGKGALVWRDQCYTA